MAQIRSTGGFSGANLKPATERGLKTPTATVVLTKRGKKKVGGGPPIPGGGVDLVADLKNFLRVKKAAK